MSLFETLKSVIDVPQFSKARPGFLSPLVVVLGSKDSLEVFKKTFEVSDADLQWLKKSTKPCVRWLHKTMFVIRPSLYSAYPKNSYAQAREALGSVKTLLDDLGQKKVQIHFLGCDQQTIDGGLLGLQLANYRYKNSAPPMTYSVSSDLKDVSLENLHGLGASINLCRHLTNLPANLLNTHSYAQVIEQLFKSKPNLKCEVWSEARLKKENMGLLVAVGESAEHRSTFVHLQYRPRHSQSKPIALVGKGIVFDSGGLDLKPASGMRIMKKDMSGSAVVLSVLYWAVSTQDPTPLDVYIPLAENAVSANSFRPGDVLTSRSGQTVEIHNTDAEGRLVLADALDVAVKKTGKDQPLCVIDVATLTGAIKVGLGSDLAGLFSNDDTLAKKLETAADKVGDPFWRMPLYQKYRNQLNSTVADLVNSTDGFGGAITAALFLENFVNKTAWAHLDIYGWKDQAEGCLMEPGGSGQAVQALIQFIKQK